MVRSFFSCREYRQKHFAKRLLCMAAMYAKESLMPFRTLLSLAKKRFTRENKDNDKNKKGAHKCPYIEQLHDMKILYK